MGNTLFGIKVEKGEEAGVREALESTGYTFEDMTSNAAFNVLYGCQRVGSGEVSFDEDEA